MQAVKQKKTRFLADTTYSIISDESSQYALSELLLSAVLLFHVKDPLLFGW